MHLNGYFRLQLFLENIFEWLLLKDSSDYIHFKSFNG